MRTSSEKDFSELFFGSAVSRANQFKIFQGVNLQWDTLPQCIIGHGIGKLGPENTDEHN